MIHPMPNKQISKDSAVVARANAPGAITLREMPKAPKNLYKWNWGAFFFSWIWGIANGVKFALLALIPVVGLGVAVELGRSGNERAWRGKKWMNTTEFEKAQERWSIAALCSIIVLIVGVFAWLVGSTLHLEKASDNAETIALRAMRLPELQAIVGEEYSITAFERGADGRVLFDVKTRGVIYRALVSGSNPIKSVSLLRSGIGKGEVLSAPAEEAFSIAGKTAPIDEIAGVDYSVDEELWIFDGSLSVGFGILGENGYYYIVCSLNDAGEPGLIRMLALGDDLSYTEIWRSERK